MTFRCDRSRRCANSLNVSLNAILPCHYWSAVRACLSPNPVAEIRGALRCWNDMHGQKKNILPYRISRCSSRLAARHFRHSHSAVTVDERGTDQTRDSAIIFAHQDSRDHTQSMLVLQYHVAPCVMLSPDDYYIYRMRAWLPKWRNSLVEDYCCRSRTKSDCDT